MSLRPRSLDFEDVWGRLRDTCYRVLALKTVEKAVWNDRFTDVYALCVAYPEPHSEKLYHHMKRYFEDYVKMLYDNVCRVDQSELLQTYHRLWTDFSNGALYLNHMFMYLNNQFVKKMKVYSADLLYGNPNEASESILEIGDSALDAWKKGIINPLRATLSRLLLEAIDADRRAAIRPVQDNIIRDVIHSFVRVESEDRPVLELYRDVFETPFLAQTADYYAREGSEMIQKLTVSQYMEKVTVMIAEETARAHKFIHQVSHSKVTEECQNHLVGAHLPLFYNECPQMIEMDRRQDLMILYNLLKPIKAALQPVAHDLRQHIEKEGLEAIKGIQGEGIPCTFVESLLDVHEKYSSIIREVFATDQIFTGALDKAFGNVINHRTQSKAPCRSPELLARYCDMLLKKSTKSSAVSSSNRDGCASSSSSTSACSASSSIVLNTDTEIEDKLSKSIILFKYLDDKDVFQKFYSKMMAKRLIHQLSLSMDMEEAMINKFKQVCGYEFTNKLHRMFTDMSLSTDHNAKFNEFLRDKQKPGLGVGFHIYVLQAGAWPLSSSNLSRFAVPQVISNCVQTFEEYYQSRFNGRKLSWLYNLANGELRLSYMRKTYFVTMGTYQLGMMLQFERGSCLTRKMLMDETLLNEETFERQLQSLVDAKLLTVDGDIKDPGCIVALNEDYSNKRTRFKITAVLQKESPQEVEQTRSSVEEDRKLYLQAAVVRIMKSRKVLKHNALIEEVINYAKGRFSPSIPMIKKCTETLIEKQYIERCADAPDTYSYIA